MRALVKLEQVLPSHLRRRVNALQTATVTLAASGPTVDPETLTAIAGASRDRERLRFAYRGRDATESRRCVEPHTLVNLGRRWYLVAWDCDREDWRTFRVDRLDAPVAGRHALRAPRAAQRRRGGLRRGEPVGRAVALPGARHAARLGPAGGRALALHGLDRRGDRRAHVRAAHERRLARLAGRARGHARRRLRGPRAASSSSASRAGGPVEGGERRWVAATRPGRQPVAGGSCRRTRPQTPQAPSEGRVPRHPPGARSAGHRRWSRSAASTPPRPQLLRRRRCFRGYRAPDLPPASHDRVRESAAQRCLASQRLRPGDGRPFAVRAGPAAGGAPCVRERPALRWLANAEADHGRAIRRRRAQRTNPAQELRSRRSDAADRDAAWSPAGQRRCSGGWRRTRP